MQAASKRAYWLVVLEVDTQPSLDNKEKFRLWVLMNPSLDDCVC